FGAVAEKHFESEIEHKFWISYLSVGLWLSNQTATCGELARKSPPLACQAASSASRSAASICFIRYFERAASEDEKARMPPFVAGTSAACFFERSRDCIIVSSISEIGFADLEFMRSF